jgi:hypothetical protein
VCTWSLESLFSHTTRRINCRMCILLAYASRQQRLSASHFHIDVSTMGALKAICAVDILRFMLYSSAAACYCQCTGHLQPPYRGLVLCCTARFTEATADEKKGGLLPLCDCACPASAFMDDCTPHGAWPAERWGARIGMQHRIGFSPVVPMSTVSLLMVPAFGGHVCSSWEPHNGVNEGAGEGAVPRCAATSSGKWRRAIHRNAACLAFICQRDLHQGDEDMLRLSDSRL